MGKKEDIPEYEKITIYPGDHDVETMSLLYRLLRKLEVRYSYEQY